MRDVMCHWKGAWMPLSEVPDEALSMAERATDEQLARAITPPETVPSVRNRIDIERIIRARGWRAARPEEKEHGDQGRRREPRQDAPPGRVRRARGI